MWMNHTIARVDPVNVDQGVALLDTPEVRAAFNEAPGFHSLFLVNNLDDPGEMISITVWDSAEEGQAFYSSPKYRQIFGSIAHLLTASPQRKFFEVLIK
ncbi:MAG TPA: antibiotic biosynthesis monooxygenase [Anaerolineales bacterium]|nr:antibiotic biosynthesis monooxygenase [Anaerolineales bacterium]